MKKWHWVIVALLMAWFGLIFVDVFPDPYHEGLKVNLYVWVRREVDEVLRGER